MVLSASVLSGLRWTLAQIVTQKNEIGECSQLASVHSTQFNLNRRIYYGSVSVHPVRTEMDTNADSYTGK